MQAGAGKGVDALPSSHCDIFVRHFVEELTWNEIGRRLYYARVYTDVYTDIEIIRAG